MALLAPPRSSYFRNGPTDYVGAYVAQTLKSQGEQFGRASITRKLIEMLPNRVSLNF